MRILFALAWLVSTTLPSFAACSTGALAGSWYASNAVSICTVNINAQGRGKGICNRYSNGNIVQTTNSGVVLSVAASCIVTGRVYEVANPANAYTVRGRADPTMTFVVGTELRVGAFNMTRN